MLWTMFASLALHFLPIVLAYPASSSDESLSVQKPARCPLYLPPSSGFEFPHLIHPISAQSPNAVLGNTNSPNVSPSDLAAIFTFDIPSTKADDHCQLFFSFPTKEQLITSSYTFWGPGSFNFHRYEFNTGPNATTSWNNQPKLVSEENSGNGIGAITLTNVVPGTSRMVWNGYCGDVKYQGGNRVAEGGIVSWRMSSVDTCLWYFQDWNECAIGLWLVYDSDEEEA